MEGVLPILKPQHFTSHDVVAKVRKILRIKRIGHTGTLDPLVVGVLPLCIGRATRIAEYIQDLPKEYAAELTIGYATDTEDLAGTIVAQVQSVQLEEEQIHHAFSSFVGEIEQIPPMYSAVKVEGKRLYELARLGQEVERKPRRVVIHQITVDQIDLSRIYPVIRFRVSCSKGTYIRTLCSDIGKVLGYPSVMSGLERTASGGFSKEQCLTLEQVERLYADGELEERIIPTDRALSHLPAANVKDSYALRALQGQKLPLEVLSQAPGGSPLMRLYTSGGRFLGIYEPQPESGNMVPVKLFPDETLPN